MSNARQKIPYVKVARTTWQDAKFRALSAPQPNGQSLWLWFICGQGHSILPGLIPMGEAAIAEAVGWDVEGFRKAFAELEGAGLAKADWNARLVWIPNGVHYNPPQSPNVVRGWEFEFRTAPNSWLLAESYRHIQAFLEGLGEAFAEPFRKAKPNFPEIRDQRSEIRDQKINVGFEKPGAVLPAPPVGANALAGSEEPAFSLASPDSMHQTDPESTESAHVKLVFDHWLSGWKKHVKGRRPPVLDDKRRKKIRARLQDGYSAKDLQNATDGMWTSEWHFTNQQWDIELVCRDAAHVDRFLTLAPVTDAPADRSPRRPLEIAPNGPFVAPPPELAAKLAALREPSSFVSQLYVDAGLRAPNGDQHGHSCHEDGPRNDFDDPHATSPWSTTPSGGPGANGEAGGSFESGTLPTSRR